MFKVEHMEYIQCRRSGVFIVNFEHISHVFLVFLNVNGDDLLMMGPVPDKNWRKIS